MPQYSSPFGDGFGALPTNLPKMQGLPMPGPIQQAPQLGVMPSPEPRAPDLNTAPRRSEFETLISGISGLFRKEREEEEKKKEKSTAQELIQQLAALRSAREQTGAAPAGTQARASRMTSSGTPADMDDYMARNARFESGSNENAVNSGSGATGLFQFLPSTWNWIAKEAPELGLTPDGMTSRDQQMKAMRYYTNKSKQTLEPILGRAPTGGELYLLHLLGHSGGPAVLSNLDAPITQTISDGAYRGNPFLRQYTTGRDLIAGLNNKFGGG